MVPGLSNGLIAVSFGDDAIHHDQRQEKRAGASAELTNHSPLFSKLQINFHLESLPFLLSFSSAAASASNARVYDCRGMTYRRFMYRHFVGIPMRFREEIACR